MSRLPLAIPCGDPAGVGPDLIASWLQAHPDEADSIVPIGPADWIARLGRGLAVGPAGYVSQPGQPDEAGQLIALEAMELAARGTTGGRFAGVVTGPVNKQRLAGVGYPFPGQTEFFAARWGGEPVMAFAGGRMTVGLVTWHLPLADVPRELDAAAVRRTVLALIALRTKLGDARPRIAVCGLNPHAGENGMFGDEESRIIRPAVEAARRIGIDAHGPFPGDTVFIGAAAGDWDLVVAMYHDQGLIPVKLLGWDKAVNVTVGLPIVRTSPDHGTAYELAGQGKADHGSFDSAMRLARLLSA